MYCTRCGTVGPPKKITRGSLGLEVLLWLCLILPGLLYSLWRLSSRFNGCRKCGADALVPEDSPAARAAAR